MPLKDFIAAAECLSVIGVFRQAEESLMSLEVIKRSNLSPADVPIGRRRSWRQADCP